MGREQTRPLWIFTLAVCLAFGAAPLLKGGYYIGKHEGDTLHLAELVLRMAAGEVPHLDFMTPIGILAIAPIAWIVRAGAGLGHAIFLAQFAVALVLLGPAVHVATTRFAGAWRYLYTAFVMILCLALVHGEAHKAVSISMHYNRWAWAVSYVIVPLALMRRRDGSTATAAEGLLIGAGLALLLLTKVTYFAAILPAVLVALLGHRARAAFAGALLAGLALCGLVTLLLGPGFWLAYLKDLLTVAGSDIRPQPGESFVDTVTLPLYVGGSITALAGVALLRQSGRAVEGLALLVLVPGLFYITYQNYGNDPQWLYLLALMLVTLRPEDGEARNALGWKLRGALTLAAILALAFGLPSAVNLGFSPWRHLAQDTADYVPLLPALAAHHDVLAYGPRLYTVNRTLPYDTADSPFARYRQLAEREEPATFRGETLPECQMEGGANPWFETVGADLEQAGYAGAGVIGTDLFSAYWMFGDFRPVHGAAPWAYGGLPGIDDADYVLVPLCPMSPTLRAGMLAELENGPWTLSEVRRTDLYILLAVSRSMNP